MRKVFLAVFAASFVFAASAQAHVLATPACGSSAPGSLALHWYDWASTGNGDNGQNQPTWQIVFTPAAGGASTTTTGQVTFTTGTYDNTEPLPAGAGTYVLSYNATVNQDRNYTAASGTDTGVVTACPAITTAASSAVALGGSISDTAHLTGGTSPTGTITFNAYSASDTTCSNSLAHSTVNVSGDGNYSSATFTPSAAGSYQWVASYSGDSANPSAMDACNTPAESVVVGKVTPAITTTASAGVTLGSPIGDTATLSGGTSPTGTITFNVYSASDTTCSTSLGHSTVTVSGNGKYSSATFTPTTAGSYQWVASYSGDSNNVAVSDNCNTPAESTVVAPVTPTITTTASVGVTLGSPIGDTATLTGGMNPTGTITFKAYSASDTACATPLFTTTDTVSGNGSYVSTTFTPTTAGSYQWVASYGGDANNVAATDNCNTPAESVVVAQVAPAITTTASAGVTLGSPIGDTATLSGGTNPTGTITFNAYSASDTACATLLFTTTDAVSGNGNYVSATFTPTSAGSYQWVASYSGDTNNAPVSDACNTPAESTVVAAPPTPPAPSFTVVKLETIAGSSVAPSAGPITAQVGQQIAYTIKVTNTGNEALTISSFVDPHCDSGTLVGPIPSGSTIAVGGSVSYTCSHVVVKADGTSYTNTVTVTVTPPDSPSLPPESSTVVANIPVSGVAGFCSTSVTLHGPTGGVTKSFTARVSSQGIKSVTFYLDGKKLKTVTHTTDGKFELKINPAKLSFGAHRLTITTVSTVPTCSGVSRALEFVHAAPAVVTPKFTG